MKGQEDRKTVDGVVSAYTMSYSNTFNVFGKSISVSGNVYFGAIGGGIEADVVENKHGITLPISGIGMSFSVDFN